MPTQGKEPPPGCGVPPRSIGGAFHCDARLRLGRDSAKSKAPEDWRTPRRWRAAGCPPRLRRGMGVRPPQLRERLPAPARLGNGLPSAPASRASHGEWRQVLVRRLDAVPTGFHEGFSCGCLLYQFAKRLFGVVQPGFDGAQSCAGDTGDFFERKVFDKIKQEDRALRERELIE